MYNGQNKYESYKKRTKRSSNDQRMRMRYSSGGLLLPVLKLTDHNSGRTDINGYIQDTYRMPNAWQPDKPHENRTNRIPTHE